MSDTAEEILINFQIFCYERILADSEYFSTIATFRQDKGVLTSDIAIALSTLTATGTKIGTAVIVQAMLASIEMQNVPGSPLRIRPSFRILEEPLYNRDATRGSGKPALQTAKRLAELFHLFTAMGLVNPLIGEEPTIVPVQDEMAPIAYEVRFQTTEARPVPRPKVSMQKINTPAGTVHPTATATFTVDPSSATVYFTTDGTYPRSGQGTAWDGSTPVPITSACTLLAAAYKTGYLPSDVARQDFT
jgi:hypothetical protein